MGDGPPSFRQGFTCPVLLWIRLGESRISATGLLPSVVDLSRSLRLFSTFVTPYETSYNPERQAFRFGLFPVRSPLLRESLFVFSSSGYLDVSVPLVYLHPPYVFRWWYYPITGSGFPHSEILGSKLAYSSPRLIAAYRVLHRLLVPRHPPCALYSLTNLVIAFISKVFRIVS